MSEPVPCSVADRLTSNQGVWRRRPYYLVSGDGCWIWQLALDPLGYGRVGWMTEDGPVTRLAHRALFEIVVGPVPDKFELDHLCRIRRCVNPAHMEVVTHRENVLRGEGPSAVCAQLTHCKRGHPFNGENTRISGGKRYCRPCARLYEETRS